MGKSLWAVVSSTCDASLPGLHLHKSRCRLRFSLQSARAKPFPTAERTMRWSIKQVSIRPRRVRLQPSAPSLAELFLQSAFYPNQTPSFLMKICFRKENVWNQSRQHVNNPRQVRIVSSHKSIKLIRQANKQNEYMLKQDKADGGGETIIKIWIIKQENELKPTEVINSMESGRRQMARPCSI